MSETCLSPKQYANARQVSVHKVLGWIKRGELRAIDLSDKHGSGRPRWKITQEAIAEFESRRQASAPHQKVRRRKKTAVEPLDIIK